MKSKKKEFNQTSKRRLFLGLALGTGILATFGIATAVLVPNWQKNNV